MLVISFKVTDTNSSEAFLSLANLSKAFIDFSTYSSAINFRTSLLSRSAFIFFDSESNQTLMSNALGDPVSLSNITWSY